METVRMRRSTIFFMSIQKSQIRTKELFWDEVSGTFNVLRAFLRIQFIESAALLLSIVVIAEIWLKPSLNQSFSHGLKAVAINLKAVAIYGYP